MNALIDTESKSYREGYTKTECYGYGDLCTYFIDSQAKFDAWVANTTGNNYTHIIIKGGCGSGTSGAYETTTTINLTTTGTKTIQGVNNATINSTASSGITGSGSGGWIRDLSVNVTHNVSGSGSGFSVGFNGCANLINCAGAGTNDGSGYGYGFNECINLTNCKGYGTGSTYGYDYGYGYGFSECINLINCAGAGTNNGYRSGYGYGFNECINLINCKGYGTGTTYGYGFNECSGVSHCANNSEFSSTTATFNTANCCANQGTYSSTYAVANTANGGFNNLT